VLGWSRSTSPLELDGSNPLHLSSLCFFLKAKITYGYVSFRLYHLYLEIFIFGRNRCRRDRGSPIVLLRFSFCQFVLLLPLNLPFLRASGRTAKIKEIIRNG